MNIFVNLFGHLSPLSDWTFYTCLDIYPYYLFEHFWVRTVVHWSLVTPVHFIFDTWWWWWHWWKWWWWQRMRIIKHVLSQKHVYASMHYIWCSIENGKLRNLPKWLPHPQFLEDMNCFRLDIWTQQLVSFTFWHIFGSSWSFTGGNHFWKLHSV